MEPKSIATEILQNVENMVDPNAPVEHQLAQLRAQLEALSELPTLISQKLESVNEQMSQISVKKETMKKEVEVVQEQRTQITQKQQTVEARKRKEAHQAHVFYQQQFQPKTPGNQKHSVEITELDPDEEPEGIQIRVTKPSLTCEELDAIQREELRRSLEDVRMRKSVSPMRDASTQSNQRDQRPRKPSPAFGPNLQERPVYLPREKRPKMELDENQISETLVGQAEVIRGRAMGVNFKKFEKPPVNLDHLKNSEVYRMIHNMDNEPARGVATLRPAIATEEYMERVRSMSPAPTGTEGR